MTVWDVVLEAGPSDSTHLRLCRLGVLNLVAYATSPLAPISYTTDWSVGGC
jgi:hypothetical protein